MMDRGYNEDHHSYKMEEHINGGVKCRNGREVTVDGGAAIHRSPTVGNGPEKGDGNTTSSVWEEEGQLLLRRNEIIRL